MRTSRLAVSVAIAAIAVVSLSACSGQDDVPRAGNPQTSVSATPVPLNTSTPVADPTGATSVDPNDPLTAEIGAEGVTALRDLTETLANMSVNNEGALSGAAANITPDAVLGGVSGYMTVKAHEAALNDEEARWQLVSWNVAKDGEWSPVAPYFENGKVGDITIATTGNPSAPAYTANVKVSVDFLYKNSNDGKTYAKATTKDLTYTYVPDVDVPGFRVDAFTGSTSSDAPRPIN